MWKFAHGVATIAACLVRSHAVWISKWKIQRKLSGYWISLICTVILHYIETVVTITVSCTPVDKPRAFWGSFVGFSYKKLIRRWDSERELSLRRHRTCTVKYNRQPVYIAQQGVVIVRTEIFNIKVSNVNRFTGSFVSTREFCVNLVTHTNFTAVCVIEADFWSVSSMLEQVMVSSWNAGLPNSLK